MTALKFICTAPYIYMIASKPNFQLIASAVVCLVFILTLSRCFKPRCLSTNKRILRS
ncbi:unnamed protein product [Ixodes persulcatus]